MKLGSLKEVPAKWREEAEEASARARAAGAPEELRFVGIGMYGIVFCDDEGHAWKVYRGGDTTLDERYRAFLLDVLETEYEWLRAAAKTEIKPHVPEVFNAHRDLLVLERQCIWGLSGGWGEGRRLGDLHIEIERAMVPLGWTSPEFKEDSYVFDEETGIPVLVDITGAQRIGENLAHYVEDVLKGRRTSHEDWHSLAFFVIREYQEKALSRDRTRDLLRKLVALDPEILGSFSTPRELLEE